MSCRTTYAGSALTTFARLSAGSPLSDVATLSLFHQYRREWQGLSPMAASANAARVSTERYQQILEQVRNGVTTSDRLSEARQASLLTRLEQAEDQIPDEATIFALSRITGGARATASAQARFTSQFAEEVGMTQVEARAHFEELENGIDRSRGANDPETYTEENRAAAVEAGLVDEAGSVHAFTVMRREMSAAVERRVAETPRRIVRQVFDTPVAADPFWSTSERVAEVGYDPRNQRLEVVTVDSDGTRSEHAYHNVGQSMWEYMNHNENNVASAWAGNIRGSRYYQYPDQESAIRGGLSPRCPICGQFANTTHTCPVTIAPRVTMFDMRAERTSNQSIPNEYINRQGEPVTSTVQVRLPLVAGLRNSVSSDGAMALTNINEYLSVYEPELGRVTSGFVSGELGVLHENEELKLNKDLLLCDCDVFRVNGTCKHIESYVFAVQRRLVPPVNSAAAVRALTPEQRVARLAEAQRRFEVATRNDWSRKEEELAEARRTWQTNAEVTYSEDYETFKNDYKAAQERVAAKTGNVVPYIKTNALGGMATRESGQAFGMEIEYEFPADWSRSQRYEGNRRIGLALKEANLIATEEQQGYHAGARNGYIDKHVNDEGKGTWSWEEDGSVTGGELVTPGMYDEPETWDKLETAVSIIKQHGGIATAKAGAHVHVGTGFYGGDTKKYAELARLMTQHEDVMFRLAQNPERGNHRQGHYTAPLPVTPDSGWANVTALQRWQNGRTKVLNFHGVSQWEDNQNDHPEFRIFDSTLDTGVMQTQIKMAVAMTHAAARNASAEVGGTLRKKEPVGSHFTLAKLRGRRKPTEDEIREDTGTFRSFVDTLFSRAEDKKQMTALFAATKWCKPDKENARALGI